MWKVWLGFHELGYLGHYRYTRTKTSEVFAYIASQPFDAQHAHLIGGSWRRRHWNRPKTWLPWGGWGSSNFLRVLFVHHCIFPLIAARTELIIILTDSSQNWKHPGLSRDEEVSRPQKHNSTPCFFHPHILTTKSLTTAYYGTIIMSKDHEFGPELGADLEGYTVHKQLVSV